VQPMKEQGCFSRLFCSSRNWCLPWTFFLTVVSFSFLSSSPLPVLSVSPDAPRLVLSGLVRPLRAPAEIFLF